MVEGERTVKASKKEAHYRTGTKSRNCGNCEHMNGDGTCTKVVGIVKRDMVSDYWEKWKR